MLTYPSDLTLKYYLSLTFSKYNRPDPFTSLVQLTPILNSPDSRINLPLPAALINALNLKWVGDKNDIVSEMGADAFTGDGAGLAAGMRQLTLDGIGAAAGGGLGAAAAFGFSAVTGGKELSAGTVQQIMSAGTSAAQGITRNILQRNGLAVNPVLTQQFSNPEFKQHNFSWKFSPDSPEESATLKSIIDTIEHESKPSGDGGAGGLAGGGAFFGYPSIVTVKIMTNNNQLYKIQPCVVTNITVNYAPRSVPSFFAKTGAPVMIQVDLSLLEIILNTRENSSPDHLETPYNFSMNSSSVLENLSQKAYGILKNG